MVIIVAAPMPAPASPAGQAAPEEELQYEKMKQKPGPLGSNPGGWHTDPQGQDWYIKWGMGPERTSNELLAAKLYELAGVKIPELRAIKTPYGPGLASKIIPGLVSDKNAVRGHADALAGFAADAWLANWDVAGLEFDNLLHHPGKNEAYRVDTGGALEWRAMGAPKGKHFGEDAGEMRTLRDRSMNPNSAEIFEKMPDEMLRASIDRVLRIPDDAIRQTVAKYGHGTGQQKQALAAKLIARKNSLGKYRPA